jgi:hypothetical protein
LQPGFCPGQPAWSTGFFLSLFFLQPDPVSVLGQPTRSGRVSKLWRHPSMPRCNHFWFWFQNYSIIVLNACWYFVSQWTPFSVKISHLTFSFNKNESPSHKNLRILLRTIKSHEKCKKSLIKIDNLLNLYVFNI